MNPTLVLLILFVSFSTGFLGFEIFGVIGGIAGAFIPAVIFWVLEAVSKDKCTYNEKKEKSERK